MAGGGAPVPESNGSKKPVDFQLNLIPCIDLLSVLISFLLMTAIWTEVAKIEAKPKPNQAGPSDSEDLDKGLELTILVKANGYELRMKDTLPVQIAKIGDAWDRAKLTERGTREVGLRGEEAGCAS